MVRQCRRIVRQCRRIMVRQCRRMVVRLCRRMQFQFYSSPTIHAIRPTVNRVADPGRDWFGSDLKKTLTRNRPIRRRKNGYGTNLKAALNFPSSQYLKEKLVKKRNWWIRPFETDGTVSNLFQDLDPPSCQSREKKIVLQQGLVDENDEVEDKIFECIVISWNFLFNNWIRYWI